MGLDMVLQDPVKLRSEPINSPRSTSKGTIWPREGVPRTPARCRSAESAGAPRRREVSHLTLAAFSAISAIPFSDELPLPALQDGDRNAQFLRKLSHALAC